ncbi:MAG: hypothetical protein DRG30_00745 [Epsilonproteobacteria bacterium]|nr:MAG: hypothetical protein DRG30_00745 [Campylobacterota bacterium]
MKELEEERISQLLGIINLYPAIRIMHFSDDSNLLSKKIGQICEENDYEYQLNCTQDICYEEKRKEYAESGNIKIKQINLAQPRYAIQAKMYDYLFVTCEISNEERASFLKKSYPAIKNAGLILLFIPKNNFTENHIWSGLLEENNFVATNTLDTFSNYDVIISKKMHGWGG